MAEKTAFGTMFSGSMGCVAAIAAAVVLGMGGCVGCIALLSNSATKFNSEVEQGVEQLKHEAEQREAEATKGEEPVETTDNVDESEPVIVEPVKPTIPDSPVRETPEPKSDSKPDPLLDATEPKEAPEPVIDEKTIKKADAKLALAKTSIKNGNKSFAKKMLNDTIEKYPETDAAKEATVILKTLD